MKQLMFLLLAGTMFIFTACNSDTCSTDCAKKCCTENTDKCDDDCAKNCCTDKVATCSDDCKKACCLGCKATDGEKGCKLLATKYKKHSCCDEGGATLVEKKTHTHDDNGPHPH